MKKLLPFVFPLIAFGIVIFLAVRWYNAKAHRTDGLISDSADSVKVENLSPSQIDQLKKPAKDQKTVELKGNGQVRGQVRYEIRDKKVSFSVYADLPVLKSGDGFYQVWLQQPTGTIPHKAFTLSDTKSGFTGSAAVSADMLPVDVIVSQELKDDDSIENILLRGTVTAQEDTMTPATATPSASPMAK
jgi:hypothetical protein